MKALVLTQPWATLVAIGEKAVETRSWKTPYRGRVAIAAAKTFGPGGRSQFDGLCLMPPFSHVLDRHGLDGKQLTAAMGLILCTATLDSVLPTENSDVRGWFAGRSNEWAFGDYSPGRYAWRLTSVVRLQSPIPVVRQTSEGPKPGGALGIFDLDDETSALLWRQAQTGVGP